MMPVALTKRYAPLFDTIYFPPENSASGFVIPLGNKVFTRNGWQIKDETDTNLFQSGRLDSPKTFEIESIDCYLAGEKRILPADSRWYAEISISLQVTGKIVWESPLAKCVNPIALLDRDSMWNKLLSHDDILDLKNRFQTAFSHKIFLDSNQFFLVRCKSTDWCNQRWSRPDAPSKLVIYLNGEMALPEV